VIENTTKGRIMDEQTKNYIEILRDAMIDEPVAMTVPTEWVRAALDALEAAQARAWSASLTSLIRLRYPRLLERGNPLYDGVLAAAVEGAAPSVPGGA
jgi:hypothetical protein